jgi:hypothetical protein
MKSEQKEIILYKKVLLETKLIKPIPDTKCRELLFEYFIKENITNNDNGYVQNQNSEKNNSEKIGLESFYQISSYINLFCSQLRIFANQKTYYTNLIK